MSGVMRAAIDVRSRWWLVVLLVAVNTVPFAPVYPGSVYGDPFVVVWVGVFFFFASAPFWLAVVLLWWVNRRRTPALRSLIAELPGLVQAAVFIQYWQVAVLVLALRAVDGFLLFRLARSQPATMGASRTDSHGTRAALVGDRDVDASGVGLPRPTRG